MTRAPRLSQRAAALAPSATLALSAAAQEMAAAGRDVIDMAVGEPDFDAPAAAREAAHRALDSGRVKYTHASGLMDLRAAAAERLRIERGTPYRPEDVVVCHSAKHALSHALLALVDPGDEVLLPAPVWGSYDEQVRFAGGVPVHVAPLPGGRCAPDLEGLRAAVGPRTRGIMLNSPSNPSGYVWSEGEIAALGDLVLERDLWLISDEIYGRLVFDGATHVSPAGLGPELARRTVLVDGASKVFAMTGYRMGFLAAAPEVAKAVGAIQSQLSGCPNYVSQRAYEACLREDPPEVATMLAAFDERRRLVVEGLTGMGLTFPEPRGAFYAFPDLSARLDGRGAPGFCADLLEAEAVATVPGDVFGAPGHVRLSYALGKARVAEALERLGRFLARFG